MLIKILVSGCCEICHDDDDDADDDDALGFTLSSQDPWIEPLFVFLAVRFAPNNCPSFGGSKCGKMPLKGNTGGS